MKYGIKVRHQEGCQFLSGWNKEKKALSFACEGHFGSIMTFDSPDDASDKFNEIKSVLEIPEECFEEHDNSPMFICVRPEAES